jgi:hypothetical protein
MAYSYDFFVAEMKCPVCGAVSRADDSTEMYTYIRDEPNAEYLGVGSPLQINHECIEQNRCEGYLTIKIPAPDEPIRLLNPWRCPTCGSYNWARIEIRDGIISSIVPVSLNLATLEHSHLISNEADFAAASLTNSSATGMIGKDTVQILRERLPRTG